MDILKATDFTFLGPKTEGKVRDIYDRGDRLVLVTTDRHSSFDRIIAHIPWKGQVLNQISAWWFARTKDIVPNHVLALPDPNVTIGRKCTPLAIEAVVRGYLTGVTDTAAWTRYAAGERRFGGVALPDGMRKNERLPQPLFDPTTKEAAHDRALTPEQMIAEGFISRDMFERVKATALALFARGQELAARNGLLLVDTKYEFGTDSDGALKSTRRIRRAIGSATATRRGLPPARSRNISTRNFCGCGSATIAIPIATPPCPRRRRSWCRNCRAATSPCTNRSPAPNLWKGQRRSWIASSAICKRIWMRIGSLMATHNRLVEFL
jgi:phosphoribosylaminoimidazole-succinocarboxamide synthase